jgi:hypothetical protein
MVRHSQPPVAAIGYAEMFKMFKRNLEAKTIASDIVEDFFETQVRSIFDLLGKPNFDVKSIEAGETFAVVYFTGIAGISLSRIGETERTKLRNAVTNVWLERTAKSGWNDAQFLRNRLLEYLKEYRDNADFFKLTRKYMGFMGMDDPQNVAFLGAVAFSIGGRVNGITGFVNDVSKSYNFV